MEPEAPHHQPKGRSCLGKLLILFAVLAVLAVAIVAIGYVLILRSIDTRLDAAITEADRLDPVWRLEELFASRFDPPDGEDAADQILEVLDLLPDDWPDDDAKMWLSDWLTELPPNEELDPETAAELAAEMDRLARALAEARALAGMEAGHFVVELAHDPFATPLPDLQRSRDVTTLLRLDAARRAHEGDFDGALESAMATLGTARAAGDEPFLISQLVRHAAGQAALASADRTLGQGEASDEALTTLQRQFADEAADRSFLDGLRGERGILFDFFRKCEDGELSLEGASSGTAPARPRWVDPYWKAV